MQAVIFAAGEGKRMRPLTLTKPKPMLEVRGKPLLGYTFDSLPDIVDEVIVIVGYKEDHIRAYLGDFFAGRGVVYVRQEARDGTGGGLLLAKPYIRSGKFLTLYSDDIYAKHDIEKLLRHERAMLLARASDPTRFGVVELDSALRVVAIEEKPQQPKSNLVSTGVFLLDEKVFTYDVPLHENGERYLPDMVAALAQDHPLFGVDSTSWIQIGYPEDLARAEQMLVG